jgi:PelA/Pel-15E family pectate lyase
MSTVLNSSSLRKGSASLLLGLIALQSGFANASSKYESLLERDSNWFKGSEAKTIAYNIISHQSRFGGWPKNIDTTTAFTNSDQMDLSPTFDNDATIDELSFLYKITKVEGNIIYSKALENGIKYIFNSQYDNGGWPQAFPAKHLVNKHITLNDNVMPRILRFLLVISSESNSTTITESMKKEASERLSRGIKYIINKQVIINGTRSIWACQYDAITGQPVSGRSYELPSLCTRESVEMVKFLRMIPNPSPAINASISSASLWFVQNAIHGLKPLKIPDPSSPTGKDYTLVSTPNAPPIWARFYDIDSLTPIFSDRDGIKKFSIRHIGMERRNNYAWYGYWASALTAELSSINDSEVSAGGSKGKILLLGDSIVTNNSGWGQALSDLLEHYAVVKNFAASGRSTKSFLNENRLATALDSNQDIQFTLIQFGHNDIPGKGTSRTTSIKEYQENLSLIIKEIRSRSITPILITPLSHRIYSTNGLIKENPIDPYSAAMKKTANELHVHLIDLNNLSKSWLNQAGELNSKIMDPGITKEKPYTDRTHLSYRGAIIVAKYIISNLPDKTTWKMNAISDFMKFPVNTSQ